MQTRPSAAREVPPTVEGRCHDEMRLQAGRQPDMQDVSARLGHPHSGTTSQTDPMLQGLSLPQSHWLGSDNPASPRQLPPARAASGPSQGG